MLRVATACLLVVTVVGCGSDTDDGRSPAPNVQPAASAVQTPSATPAPTPLLAEGRNYGYIQSVDIAADPRTVEFDLAEFLTGDAADRAAVEDGFIEPGEHVDNDYYVRNRNKRLRTVPLASDVRIRLVDWSRCCDAHIDGELEPFAAAFRSTPNPEPGTRYRGASSPYWLTVKTGVVVEIEEQYLP